MGDLLAVICDSCGQPMVPNVSTLDDDGCGWICIDPRCPDCHAEELEPADLIECGVPEHLATRLVSLLDFYEEQRTREWGRGGSRREAGGAPLRRDDCPSCRSELGVERHTLALVGTRLRAAATACHEAGDLAEALDGKLYVSYISSFFDEGQATKQSLAVLAQLCHTVTVAIADAQARFEGIDPALVGLRSADDM
jgi:hypothetical protein